jgi:hypothetical protein
MTISLISGVVIWVCAGMCVTFLLALILVSVEEDERFRWDVLAVANQFLDMTACAAAAVNSPAEKRGESPNPTSHDRVTGDFATFRYEAASAKTHLAAYAGEDSEVSQRATDLLTALAEYRDAVYLSSGAPGAGASQTDVERHLNHRRAQFAHAVWTLIDTPARMAIPLRRRAPSPPHLRRHVPTR